MSEVRNAPAPDELDPEGGFTLIELLMAVVIMGIAVVTVVTSMAVAANSTDEQRQQVDVGLALTTAAEAVKAVGYQTSTACSSSTTPFTTAISGVLEPPDWGSSSDPATVQSVDCSLSNLQTVNLSVTSPSTRATATLSVVLRNQS